MIPERLTDKKPVIIIFYPHYAFSPRHGSHLRCLQQLDDLRGQYDIIIASSSATSDSDWPSGTRGLRDVAINHGIKEIAIFEQSLTGYLYRPCSLILLALRRLCGPFPAGRLSSLIHQALFLVWFNCLAIRHRPRATIIHYTYWAYLSRCMAAGLKVLELHDLLPVNHYLARCVISWLEVDHSNLICTQTAPISYVDHEEQLPGSVVAEIKRVVSQISRFDLVWMISCREDRLLRELDMRTASDVIYPIMSAVGQPRHKTLPPILPIGPNPFNTYSLVKFIEDVLPSIDRQFSEQIEIQVTGRFWDDRQTVLPSPLKYYGVIDNYAERLAQSSFMIAPTSVGTGQQIKIFEALAMATPVIAYRCAVPEDILAENPSIIGVDSPAELAAVISKLLGDEQLLKHYWDLASEAAERQAGLRSERPYSRSLGRALAVCE